MKEKSGFKVLAWVVLGLVGFNIVQTWGVHNDLTNVLRHVTIRKTSMTTSWESNGEKHAFTTHLGSHSEDETDAGHVSRHHAGFEAMLSVFPVKR